MLAGHIDGHKTSLSSMFEAVGAYTAGKIDEERLHEWECKACPTCEGRGFVRTAETVCLEILREILRQVRQFGSRELVILAHQDVIDRLLDEEAPALSELEAANGRPIRLADTKGKAIEAIVG